MPLRYLVGEAFNACDEANELIKSLAAPHQDSPALRTAIDMVMSFQESKKLGFSGIKDRWKRSETDELFLYINFSVIGALRVPGNGRHQTYDLTFAGCSYYPLGTCVEQNCGEGVCPNVTCEARMAFRRATASRIKIGAEHEWD
jgi:hypothetical protein